MNVDRRIRNDMQTSEVISKLSLMFPRVIHVKIM
jgi:hypothetical protein